MNREADQNAMPEIKPVKVAKIVGNQATTDIQTSSWNMAGNSSVIQRMWGQKGVKISTLDQLNSYIKSFESTSADITVADFTDIVGVTLGEINEFISVTNDTPHDRGDAIKAIAEGIKEARVKKVEQDAEQKLKDEAALIETKDTLTWSSVKAKKKQSGTTFIGVASAWHIHTNIGTQEHIQYGKDIKNRRSTNNSDNLLDAVAYLLSKDDKLKASGAKDCYMWLRNKYIDLEKVDFPKKYLREFYEEKKK